MQCAQDAAFGPSSTCRTFDFTLRFSNLVLLLTPSAALLAAALVRVPLLLRKPDLAPGRADPVGVLRTGLAGLHAVFALAMMSLVLQRQTLKEALDADSIVPGVVLAFLASLAIVPGSMLERRKTARGTAWLPAWLFASCLFEASRVRTFSRVPAIEGSPFFALTIVGLLCKAGMLAAENTSGVPRDGTAESRASFLSQLLFLWLWPTIWRGFRAPLQLSDLDELSFDFKGLSLGRRIASVWLPGSEDAAPQRRRSWRPWPSGKTDAGQELEMDEHDATTPELHSGGSVTPPRSLLLVCLLSFPGAVLAPAVPRMIMVAATLAQPYLVSATLTFAESFQDGAVPQSTSNGWGLVGAYALVYTVQAFSTGQYYWLCAKAIVKLRGGLIQLLYGKSLKLHVEAAKRSGGGAAANLISVDLERFVKIVDPVHNLTSSIVVVAVGLYILYSQIGAVFIATLLAIALNLTLTPIASSFGTNITKLQGAWSAKTDARVNLLESAVRDAKGVKFAAYEGAIEKKLLAAREAELTCAKSYLSRLLVVISSSNLNVEIMSLATFTALGVVDLLSGSRRFTLNTVFTSLTTIAILETPLLQIGQQYASIVSAYASIKRIEAFLRETERPPAAGTNLRPASAASLNSTRDHKTRPASVNSDFSVDVDGAAAATLKEATIGWAGKPVLTNVTLSIPRGRLSMVCGRIGAGKSTLLLGLLGEADVLSGESQLPMLARPVAFCAQDNWMMEGASIRDNILFDGAWDAERYQTALRACCLDVDVLQLAQRDRTPAKALSGGQRQRVSLARALYADAEAYVLDDVTSALDAETAAALWRNLMGPQGLLRGKTIVMASNALHLLPSADFIVRLEEGKVAESGRFEELSVKGKQAISRASIDTERATAGDSNKAPAKAVAEEQEDEVEDMENGTVAWSAYNTWFAAMGWRYVALVAITTWLQIGAIMGMPIWLQHWARDNDAQPNAHLARNACVLLALIAVNAVTLVTQLYILFVTAVSRAGRALHARQLHAVLFTSLAFFSSNPAGRIINRFSQDLFTVDWELGIAVGNFSSCSAQLLGYVIILCVPAPYLIAVFVGLAGVYYALQRLYMPASRQLRRLEMACKSPLITSLAEASSESGLATVRALGRQRKLKSIMTARLDASQKPYMTLWAVRHWLRTYLNIISGIVNCALVILVVVLRQSTSIGILAVALVQATQLPIILNQVLMSWTEVEILSIALERIHGFSILEPEESTAKTVRPHLKPDELRGGISVRDLTVSYTPEAPPAIQDLSFEVAAGTRLGVVGRSGSGKSTLLLALFRMLEAQKPGSVLLDGTPIDELNVHSLRSCLSIIPQQPLILAASVRDNLDPDGERDDPQLWAALVKTKLDGFVRGLPQGLDTMLLSAEGTLSAGQKQLFSLARALLRQRKVLVLDEATSSLDHQTDVEFQQCLRDHFDGVTIIAVAHRIVTVRHFDRILVMANGRALEYDTPDALMARPDSAFRALAVEQRVA